ncbi:PAS domain-containing protein [Trichocoleus sp. FACHB-591]|uniref:PAS domain-containing protein n=1 Tax=Trichocoleus sp. FACHB-591 TaxID=2692872 RepID=UPI0016871C4F|nr:PAS domain-containing protein [Trichocoleus sp. FACHB-591]MBD2094338.1 PAS domain-containing protein [Trichocoleus sp. FACHB-591]
MPLNPLALPVNPLELVIDRCPLRVTPQTPVLEVARLMSVSDRLLASPVLPEPCALVMEAGRLVGLVTAQQIMCLMVSDMSLPGLCVAEVMGEPPLVLQEAEATAWTTVGALLPQPQTQYLVIADEREQIIGVATLERLCLALLSYPQENQCLEQKWATVMAQVRDGQPRPTQEAPQPLETALQIARAELENQFEERTAALRQASDELIAEIVHHRRTEVQLSRRTFELKTIFQAFPDLYFQVDVDGTILDYHANDHDDLYVPPEKFLGKRMRDVLPASVAKEIQAAINRVVVTRTLVAVEYSLPWQDTHRHFEARILPFLDQKMLVIVRDISDRIRAEAALRKSEATTRALLAAIPDLMIRMNSAGDYLDFLPAKNFKTVVSSTGWQKKNVYEVMPPAIAQERMFHVERALQTGMTQVYEFELCLEGETFTEEARIAVSGEDEVLVIVRDITDRKQAEAALKAQKEFLCHVIDTVPNLIFVKDWQGRFTLVNQTLANMYGTSVEDLLGKTDADFNPNSTEVAQFLQADREVILRMQDKVIPEETVTDANGRTFWFQTIKKPLLSPDGKAYQVLGVATDITAHKQAEVDLQLLNEALELKVQKRTNALQAVNEQLLTEITERQRAEEQIKLSLREKEVLLKEIHHRVKNNLQVISSLLKLQAGSIKEYHVLEILKESQNRVRAMALLHEKLYQSEDLAKVNFAEYVHSLVANLFRSYGVKSQTITAKINVQDVLFDIDAVIPCGLIINELISNSLKYAFPESQKGEVSVELVSTEAGECQIVVSDNGVGLPKELDFYHTESLGLQLVCMLTEQLEGRIELDRSSGAVFRISLKPIK